MYLWQRGFELDSRGEQKDKVHMQTYIICNRKKTYVDENTNMANMANMIICRNNIMLHKVLF